MELPRPAFLYPGPRPATTTAVLRLSGCLALSLALSLAICLALTPGSSSALSPTDTDRRLVASLLDRVDTVPRRVHVLGYERDEFGDWSTQVTPEGHLCTTRDVVLFQTFGTPAVAPDVARTDCPRATGSAIDVYTGNPMVPGDVQIDHVVPLAAAWDHGAHGWPRSLRTAFANDDGSNLLAVSAEANQSKSDGTPGEWLPTAGGAVPCAYLARYLTVSVSYRLTLSADDADAARRVCRL